MRLFSFYFIAPSPFPFIDFTHFFFSMCNSFTPALQKLAQLYMALLYYSRWAYLGNYMDGKKTVLDLVAKICVLGICTIVSIIKHWVVNYTNRNMSL